MKKINFFSCFVFLVLCITPYGHGFRYDDQTARLIIESNDMQNIPALLEQYSGTKKLILFNFKNQTCTAMIPDIFSKIYALKQLEFLSFFRCNLDVFAANKIQNILTLEINDCEFDGNTLAELPQNLSTLVLQGATITDEKLMNLPQDLTTLKLVNCPNLTDNGLKNLPKKLTWLEIRKCNSLSHNCLALLPKNLTILSLVHNTGMHITDADIAQLPGTLMILKLRYQHEITDKGIAALPRKLIALILFGSCKLITDAGLKKLPPNLELLCFEDIRSITGHGLFNLPNKLFFLYLLNTWSISHKDLEIFQKTRPFLEIRRYVNPQTT